LPAARQRAALGVAGKINCACESEDGPLVVCCPRAAASAEQRDELSRANGKLVQTLDLVGKLHANGASRTALPSLSVLC
jgi:hypothetical protein